MNHNGLLIIMTLFFCFTVTIADINAIHLARGTGEAEGINQKEMEVHFINVGQGDSTLVKTPNGKTMLIDGGPPSAGEKVVTYLKQQGVTSIDVLVATHPDIDHIGGLITVIKELNVKKIIDSGKIYYTDTYFEYLKQIKDKDIPVSIAKSRSVIEVDSAVSFQVLNTFHWVESNNQSSLVFSLDYKQMDFLLMADVEIKQEKKLIKTFNLQSEFLKVAHHGSVTSTSREFLEKVKPEKAILSYSKDNHYGHPDPTIIENLQQAGATIYSTAKAGDIVVTTNGYSYTIDVSGTKRLVYRSSS
ncbi:MBL fold metallo-hydrolase [Aquibacillus halophilus]|uniref:MBL fold metallo-hydrolase n=1 Tax=Aquibacillus halophilus TaxID=930132 RepID=A0A6A8DG24_9BACI|nr:ComEC/Rec2 family competence protein [Aquibacillus halophilus]MRH44638.1 MBL fold metallo-hydrolase [Aquibacillus halophilus]